MFLPLQGLRAAKTGVVKAEPTAALSENGHVARSRDEEAAMAGGGMEDGDMTGNSNKRVKLEDGNAAARGGGLTMEQELLACQGHCRSVSSTSRHLSGQLEAERLRVCDVSNRLAEREAEVDRLLLRIKEVRIPTCGARTI
jgi:hypothetical protein